MANEGPDFEISEASISGTHQRADLFNQPRRSRQRVTRITAQISILVVIVLAAGFFVVRAPLQAFISARQGPAPTATRVPPPLAQLVIGTDVTYGTLTVNGTVMPFNPNSSDDTIGLTKQQTTLTLNASPFQPITCVIDIATLGQTPNQGRCSTSNPNNNIFILDMNFDVADMAVPARQQFATFMVKELALLNGLQATVPAKEHYASGVDARLLPTVAVAATPLRAQIQTMVNTSGGQGRIECMDGICPGNIATHYDPSQPLTFNLQLELNEGWRFSNSFDQQIASYLPINNELLPSQAAISDMPFIVQLQYTPASGWNTAPNGGQFGNEGTQLANNFCQTGAVAIAVLLRQQGSNLNESESFGTNSSLTGCLFAFNDPSFQQGPNTATVTPTKDTDNAWFMVHFGAVLTVNPKAHALLPTLPQATSQEVTEVEQATQ